MNIKKILLSTITPQERYIQLGLYNLKSYALAHFEVDLPDIDIYEIRTDKYPVAKETSYPYIKNEFLLDHAKYIVDQNPQIVGFSCFMWNIDSTLRLCKLIKNIYPKIIIVLGGPEVSINTENILRKNPAVNIIARDEGEAVFLDILKVFVDKNKALKNVGGISYRLKKNIFRNPDRKPIDLNTLPSPYLNGLIDLKDKECKFSIETSRGCPFNCSYCTYSVRMYHNLRFFPLERVKREFEYIFSQNPDTISINDDNFNIYPKRSAEILNHIQKMNKGTDIQIFLNASMWKIEKEFALLLKKNNVKSAIGVQSIHEDTLAIIRRKNKIPVLEENLGLFDKYGIAYRLHFIIGLPGDNLEKIKKNIDWVSKFRPEEVYFFPLMMLRGTKLYDDAKKLGIVYQNKPPYVIYRTKLLTHEEFIKVVKMSYLANFLYNSGFLKNTIHFLASSYNIRYTDIIEMWNDKLSIPKNDLDQLKITQYQFVKSIALKFKLRIPDRQLNEITSRDFSTFSRQAASKKN